MMTKIHNVTPTTKRIEVRQLRLQAFELSLTTLNQWTHYSMYFFLQDRITQSDSFSQNKWWGNLIFPFTQMNSSNLNVLVDDQLGAEEED